ncbi:UNVERIFIED_CONTAM: hypothetical protein GTU68_053475 [Idotea baltica]|nr:hypothetical protein [Idotea baltica]
MFQSLSNAHLDWSLITIGLVDERAVPPQHDASNEGLVRRTLLQGRAAAAKFLPMWSDAADVANVATALYQPLTPFDFILLGMGDDGHTASWFPAAKNLNDAMDGDDRTVVAIDAAGCPVAGDVTNRITLTRSAVTSARHAVLLIFGDEKRCVIETAMTHPAADYPVSAATEGLGSRLTICGLI